MLQIENCVSLSCITTVWYLISIVNVCMKNFVLLINIFFEFYNQLLLSVKLSIYFGHKELGMDSETREQGMKKV